MPHSISSCLGSVPPLSSSLSCLCCGLVCLIQFLCSHLWAKGRYVETSPSFPRFTWDFHLLLNNCLFSPFPSLLFSFPQIFTCRLPDISPCWRSRLWCAAPVPKPELTPVRRRLMQKELPSHCYPHLLYPHVPLPQYINSLAPIP